MTPELSVAVPFHSLRQGYLKECFESIVASKNVSIEIIGINDRSSDGARELAEKYCNQIIDGPGFCNRRPGAIHWPVFQAWLTTRCPYVTYLFSDDRVEHLRYGAQVEDLKKTGASAAYTHTTIIDSRGKAKHVVPAPGVGPHLFGGIPAFTESLVLDRKKFFEVGGLDYPIHVAALAEAWIWAAAGAAGKLVRTDILGAGDLEFREHPETITESGKTTYADHVKVTRFREEQHWELWNRVEQRYRELVEIARGQNA